MNLRKEISLTLGVLFVIIVALVVYWYGAAYVQNKYTSEQTPYKSLVQQDRSFAEGLTLMKAGQYAEAKDSLQASLANVTDSQQEAQVLFKIALATEYSGDFDVAIMQYKQIAANPTFYKQIRAYAVQQLGTMYYTYGASNPAIITEIFKDSPYKEMAVGGDNALALRHLNEYAVALYPLAPALLRQADWYAIEIGTKYRNATSSAPAQADMDIIAGLKEKARADLDRMRKDANETGPLIDALNRLGAIERRLAMLGLGRPEDVIAPLREAIGLSLTASTVPGQDSFPRYQYAVALAYFYGEAQAEEIKTTVSSFSAASRPDTAYTRSFEAYVRNLRSRKDAQYERTALIKIASIAPEFKKYLLALGWTSNDFTR